MKITHILKTLSSKLNPTTKAVLTSYGLYDSDKELIATVVQKTSDASIHQVLWYGGDKHGKSDLTEGGIEGLMDFVAL